MIKLNYIKQTAFEYFDVWSYVKYWDSFRSYRFYRNEFFVKYFGYKNFKFKVNGQTVDEIQIKHMVLNKNYEFVDDKIELYKDKLP